jgi:hypothetical protein
MLSIKNHQSQILYESQLHWLSKVRRLLNHSEEDNFVKIHTLDHFIRREVSKKL